MIKTNNSLLFVIILFLISRTNAQSNIQDLMSCLLKYESKVVGKEVLDSSSLEEELSQYNKPLIGTSVQANQDLINNKTHPINSSWSVYASQNVYSASTQKKVESQRWLTQAYIEKAKVDVSSSANQKLDQILNYILNSAHLENIKTQVETQKKVLEVLNELVRARIIDGATMLIAESDLAQMNIEFQDVKLQNELIEKDLQSMNFFRSDYFKKIENLDSYFLIPRSNAIKIEERPQLKSIDFLKSAQKARIAIEESAWQPNIDLNLSYTRYLDNPEKVSYDHQLIAGISLSFPISDIYSRTIRKSSQIIELARLSALEERTRKKESLSVFADNRIVNQSSESIKALQKSIEALESSKAIMLKKLQLNKVSYTDIANIDERLQSVRMKVLVKKIEQWKIISRWTTDSILKNNTLQNLPACSIDQGS